MEESPSEASKMLDEFRKRQTEVVSAEFQASQVRLLVQHVSAMSWNGRMVCDKISASLL